MTTVEQHFLEDLKEGMSASLSKTVTDEDVVMFAKVSGDCNPVHLDEEFAKNTMFKGRIAHGMLGASLISAVLGTKLPGVGAIYVGQSLKFKAPVKLGDTITATVTVKSINASKKFVEFETIVTLGEKKVIEGEATIMVPSRG